MKKRVMLLIYTIVAVSIPLIAVAPSRGFLYAAALLFGIGLGGDYMIIPLMTAEIFGMRVLGRLLGVILTAGGVAEAVSPWLTGRLRDTTGDYSISFAFVTRASRDRLVALALPFRAMAVALSVYQTQHVLYHGDYFCRLCDPVRGAPMLRFQ